MTAAPTTASALSLWRIVCLLLVREWRARQALRRGLDAQQRRARWVRWGVTTGLVVAGIAGGPAVARALRGGSFAQQVAVLVGGGVILTADGQRRGREIARRWNAGADLVWRLAGVSAATRARLALLQTLVVGALLLPAFALAVGASLLPPSLAGAGLWAAMSVWTFGRAAAAAAERQPARARLAMQAAAAGGSVVLLLSVQGLLARAWYVGVAALGVAVLVLAEWLWRAALASDAPEQDRSFAARPTAAVVDRAWGQARWLWWREGRTLRALPLQAVVQLLLTVGGSLVLVLSIALVPALRGQWGHGPAAGGLGALLVCAAGMTLAQLELERPTRAWWGWARQQTGRAWPLLVAHVGVRGAGLSALALVFGGAVAALGHVPFATLALGGGVLAAWTYSSVTAACTVGFAALGEEGGATARSVQLLGGLVGTAAVLAPLQLAPLPVGGVVSLAVGALVSGGALWLAAAVLRLGDFGPIGGGETSPVA